MAGVGLIPVWAVLISGCLGAIAGDAAAYWLGRSHQAQVLRMRPMSRCPAAIGRSEEFFARHGGKSITMARFIPVVRAFVPLIAGISGMCPRPFYAANITSAALWAISHIIPAAAAGASLLAIRHHMSTMSVTSLALAGVGLLMLWNMRPGSRRD